MNITPSQMIQDVREWHSEQTRTPVEVSINNALADMENFYGSDDPTEQEELLQLPSSID